MAMQPVLSAEVVSEPIPVNLLVGQQTNVLLDGNPSTGYIWQVTGKPQKSGVVRVSLSNAADSDASMCCGLPLPTTLTITALQPGRQHVRVVYSRPWEKKKAPADEKIFAVTVSPDKR